MDLSWKLTFFKEEMGRKNSKLIFYVLSLVFFMLSNSVETHFWHVSALLNLKLLHDVLSHWNPFQAPSWVDKQHTTEGRSPKLGNYLWNRRHSFKVSRKIISKKYPPPNLYFPSTTEGRRETENERERERERESVCVCVCVNRQMLALDRFAIYRAWRDCKMITVGRKMGARALYTYPPVAQVYCDLEKSWTFVKETEIAAMILAPHFFFVTLDPLNRRCGRRRFPVSCFLCTLSMILSVCLLVLVSRSLLSKETAEGKEFCGDRQREREKRMADEHAWSSAIEKKDFFMQPMGRFSMHSKCLDLFFF